MQELPAVAKNTYYPCSKCDSERYHRVLAHLSSTEARIECEVCGSKKKLNIGKKKMATKTSTTKSQGARVTKAEKAHLEAWNELKEKFGDLTPEVYSVRGSYPANSALDHPTFGLGIVTESYPNKIEVCFEEGVKTLIHSRQ